MPRGGNRPGAGAPKGNINGLKTGKYSPRVQRAIDAILADPAARRALAELVLMRPAPPTYRERKIVTAVRAATSGAIAHDLGVTPAGLARLQRLDRIQRSSRRLRATITARIERDQRIAARWQRILDEERALAAIQHPGDDHSLPLSTPEEERAIAAPPSTQNLPLSTPMERGPGGEVQRPNQTALPDPASAQSADRKKD